MNSSNLDFVLEWGWDDFFEKQSRDVSLNIGRVVGEEKDRWRVQLERDVVVWAELPGKYRYQMESRLELPSVGDWVLCQFENAASVTLIKQVMARKSCLYRRAAGGRDEAQILASNVDYAFVLTSANRDLNVARLERYISLIWDSGATPVVLVTKADLAEDIEAALTELREAFVGVEVFAVSVPEQTGLEQLAKFQQRGKVSVFIGSSGVGKSTLTNFLLGSEVLLTQEIRANDDCGRHTTTARYIFPLSNGSFVIDTPGMRSLSLMDDQGEGVDELFSDIVALENACCFNDCEHRTEPGCAVLEALDSGNLDEERWARYRKLQREVHRKLLNEDHVKLRQEREKWKKITKQIRATTKLRRG